MRPAAIVEQEAHQRPQLGMIGAVMHVSPFAPGAQQPGLLHRRKVKRECRCADLEPRCDLAGAQPFAPGADKQAQDVEPGFVGQRRKRGKG